jgi:hypothetical protein
MVDVLALTLTWTPGIRGVLVVAVGIIVLMGSVYLMLGTNSGFRLGFLLALTGLMGWMTIMGVVWMIYGIGRTGPAPTWEVLEINRGDLTAAENEEARSLPEPDALPEAAEFLEEDDDLAAQFEQQPRPPTLGDLVGVKPEIQDDLPLEDGWHLLSTSDPQTGEAQATASAYLVEERKLFASSSEYVVIDTYSKGGKTRREGDEGSFERAGIKIKNSLTPFHPPHYAVVQVRKAVEQAEKPGQPPPLAVPDEEEPVISVIMERNLGAKRRPSFFLTLFSLVVFLVCCNTLNRRERLVNEARSNLPAKV